MNRPGRVVHEAPGWQVRHVYGRSQAFTIWHCPGLDPNYRTVGRAWHVLRFTQRLEDAKTALGTMHNCNETPKRSSQWPKHLETQPPRPRGA